MRLVLQRGLSLIELMVAIAIGLVVSLVIFNVLSVSEARKRTTTGTNDMNQNGVVALYQLDQAIRGAGSGFAYDSNLTFGCKIASTLKDPPSLFNGLKTAIGGNFRMAPVVIQQNATSNSDMLIVMSGSAGYGEVAIESAGVPTSNTLHLFNTLSFHQNDRLLVVEQPGGGAPAPCDIATAGAVGSNPSASDLPLSAALSGSSYSVNTTAINLGPNPSLQLYGVDSNYALVGFDLLAGSTLNVISDGVMEMHALYGIDNTGSGSITWTKPEGNYAADQLMNGSSSANQRLTSIKAIRVGLITRSAVEDKKEVSPANLEMFVDTGLTKTINLTDAQKKFRYRVLEATIPLRNALTTNN